MISYKDIQNKGTSDISHMEYLKYINECLRNAPIFNSQSIPIQFNTKIKIISIFENIILNNKFLRSNDKLSILYSEQFNYQLLNQLIPYLDNITELVQSKPIDAQQQKKNDIINYKILFKATNINSLFCKINSNFDKVNIYNSGTGNSTGIKNMLLVYHDIDIPNINFIQINNIEFSFGININNNVIINSILMKIDKTDIIPFNNIQNSVFEKEIEFARNKIINQNNLIVYFIPKTSQDSQDSQDSQPPQPSQIPQPSQNSQTPQSSQIPQPSQPSQNSQIPQPSQNYQIPQPSQNSQDQTPQNEKRIKILKELNINPTNDINNRKGEIIRKNI